MHFLRKYRTVGVDEFLEDNRDFLSALPEKTQRIIQKKLMQWRVDPMSLTTKKMHRPPYGGFTMWESYLTDKYRLRFAVSELQEIIVPATVDLLHDDRNNTIDTLLKKTVHTFMSRLTTSQNQ